jgi:glycosyltransferase involved in cell wall biosynthesis
VLPDGSYDAYLAWNEPDLLRPHPTNKLKICVQQLNDFTYCNSDFDRYVDAYVMPSETHRKYLGATSPITRKKTFAIPNSINLDLVAEAPTPSQRKPGSLIWSSSPDRGLNVALKVFLHVRERVPHATLKIFYRFAPWFEAVKNLSSFVGYMAREIKDILDMHGSNGENGIYLMDAKPNLDVLTAMKESVAQIYTCEPIYFTEGFSVSIMDAASTGCVPIISDADALPEIYGKAADVIKGLPSKSITEWVAETTKVLTDDAYRTELSERVTKFSKRFDRKIVARQWETFIYKRLKEGAAT